MSQTDNKRVPQTPEEAFERLQRWFTTKQELSELKVSEILERKDLALFYFPDPREGTNRLPLGGGYELKLVHGINRKVDEVAYNNVKAAQVKKLKLDMDALFELKPVLKVSEYRKLTDEQKDFVDTLLDSDEGSPQLSIVPAGEGAGEDDAAEVATGNGKRGGRGGKGGRRGRKGQQDDVPPIPPIPDVPELPEGVNFAETEEDADVGDYFDDGERVWQLQDSGGDELEWIEVEDPRPPAPKPQRRRRST